jgi:hypothetical protein
MQMIELSAAERARRTQVEPLRGHDGALLARLIAPCRELQRDARDQPFKCPVKFVQHFLCLTSLAHASGLLRKLEHRGVIQCVRRGTVSRGDVKGVATLWRFKEL